MTNERTTERAHLGTHLLEMVEQRVAALLPLHPRRGVVRPLAAEDEQRVEASRVLVLPRSQMAVRKESGYVWDSGGDPCWTRLRACAGYMAQDPTDGPSGVGSGLVEYMSERRNYAWRLLVPP